MDVVAINSLAIFILVQTLGDPVKSSLPHVAADDQIGGIKRRGILPAKTEIDEATPLVSVCIPAYRGAAHLRAAIDSVLAQTMSDFELIIIDDNSPDETQDIVEGYTDPRVRYLRNPTNLGPEGNWNRCLQEARGRYFKLVPQDDVLYAETLKRQIAVLEQDVEEKIALVFGSRAIINADGRELTRRGYPSGKEGQIPGERLIRRCVRFGTNLIGEPGGVLLRKTLADKVGAFDGDISYVIDLDYWVRLLRHGDGYYMTNPVSAFRVSSGSWSVDIGSGQSVEYQRFISKLRQQPGISLDLGDILGGQVMARVNNLLRLLFYQFVLKKG